MNLACRTIIPITVTAALVCASAAANEHAPFYGIWGTEKQCARAPLKPGGTVLAQPFEINADWLKQDAQWCKLNWGPVEKRAEGLFTAAHAQCGEDSLRSYFITMQKSKNQLTLRWQFPHKNGPLNRCAAQ